MGSLQAVEVVKEIIGAGQGLAGSLLIYDALEVTFRKMKLPRDPDCPLCGSQATIKDLTAHLAHAGA
jgi:adenylyltransferase/sulfurtransferase